MESDLHLRGTSGSTLPPFFHLPHPEQIQVQESRAWGELSLRCLRTAAGLTLGRSCPDHGPAEQAVWLVECQDRKVTGGAAGICPRFWVSGGSDGTLRAGGQAGTE